MTSTALAPLSTELTSIASTPVDAPPRADDTERGRSAPPDATPSVVAVEMHAKPPGNFSRRMALKRNTQIEEEQDVRRETPEDIEPRPAKTRTPNNRESCRAPANYDETKRKRPQKRKANDIRRIDGSTRKDTKIARIGPRVIERTVDDRYEWRDGNLREKEPGIS